MPTPRGRGPEWAQAEGWFASVPAYRLASFRVVLAVATLIFHVPKFNGFIRDYVSSEFHVGPALGGLPTLSPVAGLALPLLHWVTATGLLLGVWPRACAWFLAVTGAWVLLLDPEHYSHGAQFHLTLLALAGCSTDGVSLSRLLREDEGAARCPGWPERLVRFQVAIVFFYAALDKVFSPAWGLKGTGLPALRMADHGPGLGLVQRANRALLRVIPGALSVGTILTEFLLAAVAVVPRLWRVGLFAGLTFVVSIEFLLQPGLFAWDLLVAGLVFLPAGDRSWKMVYAPGCGACRRNRAILSRLDWLRRLQWVICAERVPTSAATGFAGMSTWWRLRLESPRGRAFCGLAALRVLPAIVPPPLIIALLVARFGGEFLTRRGYGPWEDLPFLLLGAYLASWLPEVSRWWRGDRPLSAATGCAHEGRVEYP